MQIPKTLFVLSLFFFTFSLSGQENPPINKPVKRINITDAYVQAGMFSSGFGRTSLADFKLLAPESVILSDDFSSFSQYSGFGFANFNFNNTFNAMVGIRFSYKEKTAYKNPVLRLGINYCNGITLIGSMQKTEKVRFDTITSNQTGQTIGYIDSVNSEYYNLNYTSQQLRFDASLIFRTNPSLRWSLFGGLGFTVGASFNSSTSISHYSSSYTQMNDVDGSSLSYNSSGLYTSEAETFKNKPNIGSSGYLPMGIDFRLGKKNELLKQIHLYYEFRPGINITSVPELRTFTNISIQQGIGIRVSW